MDFVESVANKPNKRTFLMSDKQEAPSKLTEAQNEMVRNVREMDKKTKGL
jgi:hypothetical protein